MTKLSLLLIGATLSLIHTSSRLSSVYASSSSPATEEEDLDDWTVTATPVPTPPPFNPLLELTEDTYDATIDNNEYILVEFYAKWCGVCRMVQPEYQHAAWVAHNLSLPVKLARVDVDAEIELTKRFGVETFPTFFLYRYGKKEAFPMLTTGEAYVAGLSKLLDLGIDISPSKIFSETSTSLDIASWLFWRGANEGKIANTLVYFVSNNKQAENHHIFQVFDAASRELMRNPNFRFAIIRNDAVFDDFEITSTDQAVIVMYKDHDEGRSEYTGPLDTNSLVQWVQNQATPLATVVTHRTLQRYRKAVKHLALFFVTERQAEHPPTYSRLVQSLFSVGKNLEKKGLVKRGEFTIGLVNGDKYVSWLYHYGITADPSSLPNAVVESTATETLYRINVPNFSKTGACNVEHYNAYKESMKAVGADLGSLHMAEFCDIPETIEVNVNANGDQTDDGSGRKGWEHKIEEKPFTWTEVPEQELETWLEQYFLGTLTPLTAADKIVPSEE